MNILLISEFFPTGKGLRFSGGVEARTYFIARELAKLHKVYVICSRQKGSLKSERMHGFTIYRVDPLIRYTSGAPELSDLFNRLRSVKSAINLGRQLKIDIIDGGNFLDHFAAKQIAHAIKKPVVFWYPDVFLGQWMSTSGLLGGLGGGLLEFLNLFRSADQFIAISKVTADKLVRARVSKDRIKVIPCGVDKTEFRGSVTKFKAPTIICVSRLVKYKNLKTLFFAFAHLTTQNKDAKLIVVGSGPDLDNLKDLSKALKINSKIIFFSNLPRKKLINLYQSSHVFTLPSLVEGFGIATIEAAAAGLPYVISDIPVHREVTKRSQGGFLVDALSPIASSEKLQKLLTDKKMYEKKSKEAKQLAQNYNWQKIAKQTEQVYRNLVNK